jgi:dimethylargininase
VIAVTHLPSPQMQSCVRTFVECQSIDPALASRQHAAYCQTLRDSGADVMTLDVNSQHADCVFVEDTAVVLDEMAILCSLAPELRRAEAAAMEPILRRYRPVACVEAPATLEGGDVLRVGRRLFVGQSCRTNAAGITALTAIVRCHNYEVIPVPVRGCLHLKTACTALPDGRLLVNREWIDTTPLAAYELIDVPHEEPWAANVALLGSKVFITAAHVQTASMIRDFGFETIAIDLSEFAKAEGGVTCLGLFIS